MPSSSSSNDFAPDHETLRELARVSIEFQRRLNDLKAIPHIGSLAFPMSDKISINSNYGDDVPETTDLLSFGASQNPHHNSIDNSLPIASLYLMMTRSMGLKDEDALNLVSHMSYLNVTQCWPIKTNVGP